MIQRPHAPLVFALVAVTAGTVSAAYYADDFGRPTVTGLRTDDDFLTNGPFFTWVDPANFGPKGGLEDADPRGVDWRAGIGGGYDSNPWMQPEDWDDGSYFGKIYLQGSNIQRDPRLTTYLAGGVDYTYYERDSFPDQDAIDLDLRAGISYDLTESVRWITFARGDYGQHLPYHLGPIREGLQDDDVLRYYFNSRLDYRWDGQPLGSNGWQASTGGILTGFDSRDRMVSDWADFHRLEGRQSINYVLDPSLQLGLEGRVGAADYKAEDGLQNDSLDILLTVDGSTAPGWTYHAETGVQTRKYKSSMIGDRDEFYYMCKFTWEAAQDFFISGVTSYAIEDVYNNSPYDDFFEPQVLKGGVVASRDLGSVTYRGGLEAAQIDGEIFGGAPDRKRYEASLGADWEVVFGRLSASYGYTWGDVDTGSSSVDIDRSLFRLNYQHDF